MVTGRYSIRSAVNDSQYHSSHNRQSDYDDTRDDGNDDQRPSMTTVRRRYLTFSTAGCVVRLLA